jgi:hypothetical protein
VYRKLSVSRPDHRDDLEDRRKPAIQLVEGQAIAVGEHGNCSTSAAADRTSGLRLARLQHTVRALRPNYKQIMSEALGGE